MIMSLTWVPFQQLSNDIVSLLGFSGEFRGWSGSWEGGEDRLPL